jgi:LPPG:FO 2-phospho-L-lactate transferase
LITVLAGGGGAPKYMRGLARVVAPADVVGIVNTGDDVVLHGLRISPDLDSCTYVLSGSVNQETGWGLTGETWSAMDALRRFEAVVPAGSSAGTTWFGLGDRDLATHLYRTARLGEGADLTAVTAEITKAFGIDVRLLPMTTDRVATMVTVAGTAEEISFQEYFVHRHHDVPVSAIRLDGIEMARPGPGVLAAVEGADRVVLGPSNPFVSIGPILAVAGVRERLAARRESVVAVSPIVAGGALKGPAARMLTELGHEASALGVARLYADIVGTMVIDEADAALGSAIDALGMRCVVAPTVMHTVEDAAALAEVTLA